MRRLAVALLCLSIVTLALIPTLARSGSPGGEDARVLVVRADDDLPAQVAAELDTLLRDVGGLHDLQTVVARDGAGFRDAVRAAEADLVVLLAHGDARGLQVGGDVVAWSDVRADLAASGATYVAVGACDSSLLGLIPGKQVLTLFEGEVDHRFVAPTVANDLFEQVLVDMDAAFVPRFLDYVDSQGGFDHYALIKEFPESTLQSDDCRERLEGWFAGQNVANQDRCIYYIDPASLNCFSARDRDTQQCKDLTAEDQDQENAESTGEARARFGEEGSGSASAAGADSSGGTWWRTMSDKMAFGIQVGSGSTTGHVTYGTPRADQCLDILTYDFLGGGAIKIFTTVLKSWAKEPAKEILPKGNVENSVGVRICGKFEMKTPALRQDSSITFQGEGLLDVRGSYRAMVEYEIKLWRWTHKLHFGAEAGVKYPFDVAVSGNAGFCSSASAGLRYQVDADVDGGGLRAFGYALTGYKEFGFEHDFGWGFTFQKRISRACPGQTTASVDVGPALGLGDALQRLVDAGAATVNGAPTLVHVQEDGGQVHVKAAFTSVAPGTLGFEHLRRSGALAALGIPEDLAPTHTVVLDLTSPRIQAALDMEYLGAVTPLVSLTGGVALVPTVVPVSSGIERFCAAPAGPEALLEALRCEGVAPAPLTVAPTAACESTLAGPVPEADAGTLGEDTTAYNGAVRPAPCLAVVGGAVASVNDAYDAARGEACLALLAQGADGCGIYANLTRGTGGATNVNLLTSIHRTFMILDRPTAAWWLMGKCRLYVADNDVGAFVTGVVDVFEGTGTEDVTVCMDRVVDPSLDTIRVKLDRVYEDLEAGALLLAEYASVAGFTAGQNADLPGLPSDLAEINEEVQEELEARYQQACDAISPVSGCLGK